MFVFTTSHEHIQKAKKSIKQRKREFQERVDQFNPPKNNFNINSLIWRKFNSIDEAKWERMRVGLGKRLAMPELLELQRGLYEQLITQLGLAVEEK